MAIRHAKTTPTIGLVDWNAEHVVEGLVAADDPRLSDAREPTAHLHDYAEPTHSHSAPDMSGLAPVDHDHDTSHSHTAADVGAAETAHTHDTTHDHAGEYATPHSHPYAATTHSHDYAATSHTHDLSAYATDADLATHAATPHGGGSSAPVYVELAAGTTAMAFATNDVVKVTPTGNSTYTTTVPVAGSMRRLIILTSGTTSRTITFGSGFKPVSTLATGTATARVFVINWVSDGNNLYEAGRTAAMVA